MKNRKAAGISLVALVITIIVLIILTGAVIVTFMEGGIIDRAKEAVFKNDMRTYQEILALKRAEEQLEMAIGSQTTTKLNATTLTEIQKIIPEFKEEYEGIVVITKGELSIGERVSGEELSSSEELYATWLDDLRIGLSRLPKNALASYVQVGDYVDYNIAGGTYTIAEGERSWIFNDKDNDASFDTGEEKIEYKDIMWRVLKNDGRKVTLVSAEPVESIILNSEENAFTYGPDRLDKICATVYGGRNLKVEDVNEILGVEPVSSYYNTEGTKVDKTVGTTFGDVIEETGYDVSSWSKPENYEDIELIYGYNKTSCTNASDIAKDLVFISKNKYRLSSSCVLLGFDEDIAVFGVRCVVDDTVSMSYVYYSYGDSGEFDGGGLRPVVVLNSDVEAANPSAGGDTVDTAWQLK